MPVLEKDWIPPVSRASKSDRMRRTCHYGQCEDSTPVGVYSDPCENRPIAAVVKLVVEVIIATIDPATRDAASQRAT